jgi:uncharacterized protein YbjQ (UPF0145 family)
MRAGIRWSAIGLAAVMLCGCSSGSVSVNRLSSQRFEPTSVDAIMVVPTRPRGDHIEIARLTARSSPMPSSGRAVSDASERLRAAAAKLGANAIVDVRTDMQRTAVSSDTQQRRRGVANTSVGNLTTPNVEHVAILTGTAIRFR